MTTITREWLQQTIAEFENTRDDIPFGLDDDDAKILKVLKQTLASLEADPVSFDELNAAVAEVTGSNQHAWDANIYKGHQAVPFMNYNSLSRIVDKFRAAPPVPVVPEELPEDIGFKDSYIDDWNACRAAMLQGKAEPVSSDDKLPEKVHELVSAVRSINRAKHHIAKGVDDDEPCYWQRKEWIDWVLSLCDEVEQVGNYPVIPDGWMKEAEHLAEIHGTSFVIFRHGCKPVCADPSKFWFGYDPAAPQQESAPCTK